MRLTLPPMGKDSDVRETVGRIQTFLFQLVNELEQSLEAPEQQTNKAGLPIGTVIQRGTAVKNGGFTYGTWERIGNQTLDEKRTLYLYERVR